jgi:hypothetical protein
MAKKKTAESAAEDAAVEALFGGKTLTKTQLTELRQLGGSIIDEFMKSVGISEPARLTDENGWRHLQLESAEGVAGIKESEGELFLHVEAVVMGLPSDRDLLQALMRQALEFNCALAGACSLGIRGTRLCVSATVSMRALRNPGEYASLIHMAMAIANTLDDDWQQKYGGTTRTRQTQPAAV